MKTFLEDISEENDDEDYKNESEDSLKPKAKVFKQKKSKWD